MKVFVFGAGASQGSQGALAPGELKSPLVNELFEEAYRGCNIAFLTEEHLEQCRNRGPLSVEDWLTERWERVSTFQSQKRQSESAFFGKVAFYLWELFRNVSATYDTNNAYGRLLAKLVEQDEKFGFISFNYDTLLDRAVVDKLSTTLTSLEAYVNTPLVKPHGSVNWFFQQRGNDPKPGRHYDRDDEAWLRQASGLMFNGDRFSITGARVMDPTHKDVNSLVNLREVFQKHNYFYPLILMPVTTKWYDFIDGFDDTLLSAGKKLISDASEVYVIGYSANDEVLAEMLRSLSRGSPVHVVGPNQPNKVLKRICRGNPNLKAGRALKMGFDKFVVDYEINDKLQ